MQWAGVFELTAQLSLDVDWLCMKFKTGIINGPGAGHHFLFFRFNCFYHIIASLHLPSHLLLSVDFVNFMQIKREMRAQPGLCAALLCEALAAVEPDCEPASHAQEAAPPPFTAALGEGEFDASPYLPLPSAACSQACLSARAALARRSPDARRVR